ncbi:MAG TPA: CbtA family protein [Acidimicrobiales bacterium]|nr:CbtA family protein [Acidimicrobiales bacterium]
MTRIMRLGALAGLAGGVALALFLRLVGEGPIGDAVRLEATRARSQGMVPSEMFSRATQQIGGMIGAAIYGVCVGLVFAVVFAVVRHRLHSRDDWRRAVTLAAMAFVTVGLVPELKYPANPPAVGNPDTIGQRTALYLLMVAWSIVTTWAAWRFTRWLRDRGAADHVRLPAVALLYAVLVGTGLAFLPGSPDAVAAPATIVWRFRLAALGGELCFWTVMGVSFGWLMLRASGQHVFASLRRPRPAVPTDT